MLCFGFLVPYKGLEAALGAARLAGDDVELVIAGGEHPRLKATGDGYADRLRATAPPNARFTGFVPDADVARWFAAADVALLPYPQPFASSGPLALALAHGTPVLLSQALARTTGAPEELAVADRPGGDRRPPAHPRDRRRRARPAARRRRDARGRPHLAGDRPPPPRPLREPGMTALARRPTRRPAPPRAGRVFLAGAFGQGNPGDEALLAAFARALSDHRPLAASADPAATVAAHGIAAVGRDDLRRVAREIAPRGRRGRRRRHGLQGAAPGVRARRRCRCSRRTAAVAGVSKALRKPLALVGVGAAPLARPARRARWRAAIVHAADLLVLRDEESAGHLAAIGAPTPFRVGADAAWTLVPDPPRPDAARARSWSRSATSPAGASSPTRLAAGLEPVLDAGIPVRLDPWQPDGDAALAAAVVVAARRPRAARLRRRADLLAAREGMLRRAAGARASASTRSSPAASAGVPALAVAHEPKLAGLARRLDQPAVAADAPPATLGLGGA